jgi:hypothetical protein
MQIPELALSVRQPWAWAIIHAGKDIENRNWRERRLLSHRGRIAVHAAKGMTWAEYVDATDFMRRNGIDWPGFHTLERGGIIGSVEVVDVVDKSLSRWFFGPRGLVLRNPMPCPFIPARGMLGYFHWAANQ